MIQSLKDLEKLIKLCRKQGIKEIRVGDLSFAIGEMPVKQSRSRSIVDEIPANPYENFPQGELTPEQLMFYSSGGLPENDPHRNDQ